MRSRPVQKLMRFCIEVFRQVMIRLFQAENTVFTSRSSNLSLPMSFTDLDQDRAAVRGLSMSLVILKTH